MSAKITAPYEVKHIPLANITVPSDRLRPVDDEAAASLLESIEKVGLRSPITVRPGEGKDNYVLVTGAHRFAAYARKPYISIPCFVRTGLSDEQAEMEEITENLHRKDLTELERAEQLAKWIELSTVPSKAEEDFMGIVDDLAANAKRTKEESAKSGKGGRGKKGGVNEAARVLPGVTRTGAQRAVKVAGLSKEAKAEAKALGLDDNQQALLKASKGKKATDQVAALKTVAAGKDKAKATAKAVREKAATETPTETHARKAKDFVTKAFDSINAKVAASVLVKEDLDYLIEQLQALAEKAPKLRSNAVKKIEAASATKMAAE